MNMKNMKMKTDIIANMGSLEIRQAFVRLSSTGVHVCVYNITVISFREECANLYYLLAATQKQPPVIQLGHS